MAPIGGCRPPRVRFAASGGRCCRSWWSSTTSRRRCDSQEALEASEARYRLLAEHATDVVYQVSIDGITEWVSDGVQSILGFTARRISSASQVWT